MSYKEEFKIYCSTIAGESGGSSNEAIKTVARSIITRIGFREWSSRTNTFEVIKYSGYDAYTDRSSSPNYKVVYNAMSSGKLDNLSRRIIKLVEPIYNQRIPDETGMLSLYYSPKAQTALHKKNPNKYKERPPWNFSQLERIYIDGTSKDDFNWYRYKGDGSTVKISLLNIVSSPVSGKKITVKVTDRLGKYFVKEYVTNNEGKIPDIHARKKSTIEFFVGEASCKTKITNDGKPKKVTLRDYECRFNTTTIPHTTITQTSPVTNSSQSESNKSAENNEQTTKTNNSLDEVNFNIKLVEGDTGKPLPNITYHLEYKNNIKPHKTDSSGIESGITADVSQSIGVYLDDDDGKKQSIYSMAFPVTVDLNGQTKVLKIPVVTLQLKFVDKNKKPIPNYQFKTVYRGRTSEIRKANARGIATVKALAGQPLKIIHVAANKFTRNIVTDSATEWIYSTDKLIEDPSSTTSPTSNVPSSTHSSSQKPNNTKPNNTSATDKGNVIRNDKIMQKGPTHEVKTDQAKITIKFLDEATNKPLSGLTYWTQSTKYGKNASTSGSNGTRGRTHDSDVGIRITVLVNEDGKEVKKGTIVANSDKNGDAYVYKAKKPKLESSGPKWHSRFMPSTQLSSLKEPFKGKAIAFDKAMKAAGIQVSYTNAYRPPQRQYLMYYSAMIARGQINPKNVPSFEPRNGDEPVNISWIHYNSNGSIDTVASKNGGTALFNKYGIGNNPVGKPYRSNHNDGEAFDCRISNWGIGKTITDDNGQRKTIKSKADIAKVGESYGVKHWSRYGEKATGKKDDPHWSKSGR